MHEMARAIDVPVSTYREWEYGRAITGEPYPKIALVLGVGLKELFGVVPDKDKDLLHFVSSLERELQALRDALEARS